MKKAFSLVELIVVIGIIAILSGVLLATFGGGTASARAARCLSNMKNLASACQTYGMKTGHYPIAGNQSYIEMLEERGGSRARVARWYYETAGWISADSQGMFPSTSYVRPEPISMYSNDREKSIFALTNGALWKYVSGSRETYVCPEHAKRSGGRTAGRKGESSSSDPRVNWSYLMNAYFCWNKNDRAGFGVSRREYGRLNKADKILLFSEVPFMGFNSWQPEGASGSTDTDAILQYGESGLDSGSGAKGYAGGGSGSSEEIGVNHKSGRHYFAHVVFADGHVEKLRVPMKGKIPDTSGFAELTSWLCAGYDVSFDGNRYNRVR